jgi:hypothetical protein
MMGLVVALVLVACASSVANAYRTFSGGYYSSTMRIDKTGVVSDYLSAATGAQSAWNAAGTPCSVNYSWMWPNHMITDYYGDGYYGAYDHITHDYSYPHTCTHFEILIDRIMCDGLTTAAKKDLIMHELGHAMSLDDVTAGVAVMKEPRTLGIYSKPQTDDINGVNYIW